MAPRNRKPNSSSKAGASSIPVKKASAKQSAAKKSNAVVLPPPPSSPALPRAVYVLMMKKGYLPDGFHSSSPMETKIVGVYENEEQSYAVGIRHIIRHFEQQIGEEMPQLRKIAQRKTLSLKQRMKEIAEAGNGPDDEHVKLGVKKSELFPAEEVDDNKLLDGLNKSSNSDDDSQCEGSDGGGSDDNERECEYSEDSFDYF